jgi:hypothetical protein
MAVESGDRQRMISLIHPDFQAAAHSALPSLTTEYLTAIQNTAKKLSRALASGPPVFVPGQVMPSLPPHLEWYFCGETSAGEVWQKTCVFCVSEKQGHWYFLASNDPEQWPKQH